MLDSMSLLEQQVVELKQEARLSRFVHLAGLPFKTIGAVEKYMEDPQKAEALQSHIR